MSNSGLSNSLERCGIRYESSAVGDQNVYELMCKKDGMLGGEQSGHIIIRKYATTGDGILTAIMLLEEMMDRKLPLGSLAEGAEIFPQVLENIKVNDKKAVSIDRDIKKEVAVINEKLSGRGRILVRISGTEPLVRIMAEAESEAECKKHIAKIKDIIQAKGYLSDIRG